MFQEVPMTLKNACFMKMYVTKRIILHWLHHFNSRVWPRLCKKTSVLTHDGLPQLQVQEMWVSEKCSLQPIGNGAFMWLWQKVVINWQREETSSVPNVAIIRYGTHGTSPSQKGQIFQRYKNAPTIIQYRGGEGGTNLKIICQIYVLHKKISDSNITGKVGHFLFMEFLSLSLFWNN